MPDFRMTQNAFPIASVIDAAQRNNQLQEQSRQAGNQALIQGLQSIGQVGQSLFDQKVKVAQALAGAHMIAQTPEGQQMLGTNQVASTAQGPVTQNQTAAYGPATGTATPLKSPVDVRTIATALYGTSPRDLLDHMTQAQAARTQQGELALKQQVEPQRTAIEGRKALAEEQNNAILRNIQLMTASNAVVHTQNEHEDSLRTRRDALIKDLSSLPNWMAPASEAAKKEIANIDAVLTKKNPSAATPGTPIKTGKGTTYTVNP